LRELELLFLTECFSAYEFSAAVYISASSELKGCIIWCKRKAMARMVWSCSRSRAGKARFLPKHLGIAQQRGHGVGVAVARFDHVASQCGELPVLGRKALGLKSAFLGDNCSPGLADRNASQGTITARATPASAM